MAIHQFSGRVVDQATQSGKPNLRVEALDASERYSDVIAAAVTDERGDFTLRVDDRELTKLFGKAAPELYLKVLELNNPPSEPHAIWANTATYLRWMAGRNGEGRIELPGSAINTTSDHPIQIVEGVVGIRGTSTLGAGLTVEVHERRLTKPTGLEIVPRGTTTTGTDGSYRISYNITENASTTPDLEVRVTSGGPTLATATVCAASPRVTVDVVVLGEPGRPHPGVPLFATTQNRVLRLAAEAGSSPNLAIKDINEASYEYVACRAGVPVEHVAALVQAEQLADLYSSTTNLKAETFFALLTSGIERAALFDHKLDNVQAILTDAARTRRVSPGIEDGLTAIMADYLIAAKSELSTDGANGTREFTPIGKLAMLTPGFSTTQRDLVIEYHLTASDPERFWVALDADSNFNDDDIASLKFGIDVAPLVQSWPEMVGKLQSNRAGGTPDNVVGRDLAAKDETYWNALILSTGFPPSTPGGSTDAKRANYRDTILNSVEQRYRTAFLGFRQTGAVRDFFDANPEFDFESMRLERYLIEKELLGELSGDTLTKLRGLERLFHLTSSYSEIVEIIEGFGGKVTSAYQLHQIGASGLHAAAPSLSPEARDRIMTKVCWTVWGALGMQAKFSSKFDSLVLGSPTVPSSGSILYRSPRILPDKVHALDEIPKIPEWASLFGTLDQCVCQHCRSVLSPSAYLVDVLEFMRRVATGGTSARTKLLTRRPDIARLLLSCENGSTALPYVDLVNEILEVRVAIGSDPFPAAPVTIETGETTPTLLAHPEILYRDEYVAAYTALAQEIYPFSLPFHLWMKEARVYLEHLGVPRHVLLRTLATEAGPNGRSLAIERLDLAPTQYDLLADLPEAADPNDAWGLPASPAFEGVLREVPIFLKRAGLTYDQFLELLSTQYTVDDEVALVDPTACVLAELELNSSANAAWFTETHKILRLQKVLGWSIAVTAKVRKAFGPDWGVALPAIASLKALADRTKLPSLELSAWFSDLDVWPAPELGPAGGGTRERSFFEQLFLNRAVLNPDEVALGEILREGVTSGPLRDRALGLLPGLRISQSEFELLTSASVALSELVLPPEVQQTAATLGAVSRLFRVASAAKAAKMSVHDFAILHALASIPALRHDPYVMPGEIHLWRGDLLTLEAGTEKVNSAIGQLSSALDLAPGTNKPVLSSVGTEVAWKFVAESFLIGELASGSVTLTEGSLLLVTKGNGVDGYPKFLVTLGQLVNLNETEIGVALVSDGSVLGRRNASATGDVTGTTGVDNTTAHTILFTWDASAAQMWLDGVMIGESTVDVTTLAVKRFVLGMPSNVTFPFYLTSYQALNITMAECRIGATHLSAEEVADAFAYAEARYIQTQEQRVERAHDLLDVAELVRETRVPMDELHYILRHVAPASVGLEPPLVVFEQWLEELGALRTSANQASLARDDGGGDLLLALVGNVSELVDLADDWSSLPYAKRTNLVEGVALQLREGLGVAMAKLAGAAEETPPTLTNVPERRTYLWRALSRHASLSNDVKAWASATFELPQDVIAWLLDQPSIFGWSDVTPAIYAFTREEDWAETPLPTDVARRLILARLYKVSLLAKRFGWSGVDVRALIPGTPPRPVLNVGALPVERPTTFEDLAAAQGLFGVWLRLARMAKLRDAWGGGRDAFYAFFAQVLSPPHGTDNTWLDAVVASAIDWNVDDVTQLRRRFGVEDDDAEGYLDERLLIRILDAKAVVTRLGTTAAEAITWTDPVETLPTSIDTPSEEPNSFTIATGIKRVAKSKHTDESWGEVARPLRDALRERQRTTLVDKALTLNSGWTSPNDLYRELLVDVEMSPCQLTSRLVLAHGSVQLLMNRILLGLEGNVGMSESLAREWEWMKSYRVWEANRKVFLWPENWIEPDLRDDKTPLFKDFENRLLQGPLDATRAEEAYRAYLEGLSDVSNLEIVAIHEEETGPEVTLFHPLKDHHFIHRSDRTLHVFAKNRFTNKHYYRTRTKGFWSPWEKLDLDVDTQHVMPIVVGGRLYVFWPQWTSRAVEGVPPSLDAPPPEEWGVRIMWSERRSGGWTGPASPRLERPLSFDNAGLRADEFYWLGGKPDHKYLSFTITRVGTLIRLALIGSTGYSPDDGQLVNVRIAEFDFEPGVGRIRVKAQTVLQPGILRPLGASPPETLQVYTFPPIATRSHYQAFRVGYLNQPFEPWMPVPTSDTPILAPVFRSMDDFSVVAERDTEPRKVRTPLFLQDQERTVLFDLKQRKRTIASQIPGISRGKWGESYETLTNTDYFFRAQLHYHPYVASFQKALALRGLDGLLRHADQSTPKLQEQTNDFSEIVDPVAINVETPLPRECVDFTANSAYGMYNWELFFHAPFLIALRLSQDGRHADAQKWFHYIFDPTDGSSETGPKRFWKVRPFRENDDLATIQADLEALSLGQYVEEMNEAGENLASPTPVSETLAAQIDRWREDPFDPHAIARLRISAYQKTVVIRYIQNLLAWGDQLFARDTMESVGEATQLYIFASELLGDRPTLIRDVQPQVKKSYNDVEDVIDGFGNAIMATEPFVPKQVKASTRGCAVGQPPPELITGTTYFCVPANENLLALWDLVADRLFKIRHCMNLEGVVRALPLFEPPIDPGLLVRAIAAGVDISSVLNDINAAAPVYRYPILFGKAQELCASVTALGGMVLSVLEKKDSEALSNLRMQHELVITELTRDMRRMQIEDAKQSIKTLEQALRIAETTKTYYESKEAVYPGEESAMDLKVAAHAASSVGEVLGVVGAVLHALPNSIAGIPFTGNEHGGTNLGNSFDAGAGVAGFVASQLSFQASVLEQEESYKRRKEEWDYQARIAALQVEHTNRELLGAQIRLEMAEHELQTTERQLAQSRDVERFLRSKFTNEELYGWMQSQLGSLYYQAFKLAYDAAKRAEKAFQYERGDSSQVFINFGHWDGLRAGLLAGERLAHDLRRLDAAYVVQNKREFELTKLISLAEHDPDKLIELRETGATFFSVSEYDFERDFPGHYLRRIKAASVTIPCTTGPYQGVQGTLQLLRGVTRKLDGSVDTHRGPIQSICTSQGQMDSGMFDMSFRDERLLPFEGVGAHVEETIAEVSSPQWGFALSPGNRFSFQSVDDLVLELRYTARGGRPASPEVGPDLVRRRLVRVREEFPDEWQSFISAFAVSTASTLSISLPRRSWPLAQKNETLASATSVRLYVWGATSETPGITMTGLSSPSSDTVGTAKRFASGSLSMSLTSDPSALVIGFTNWTAITDLWLVFEYSVTIP